MNAYGKKYEKPSMQVVVMNKQALVLLTSNFGAGGAFMGSVYVGDISD